MDNETLQRVRDFMVAAIATMAQVPLPLPSRLSSRLTDDWAGDMLDASALYRAYNRLPAELQESVELAYRLCRQVLARQDLAAELALVARLQVLTDLRAGTGLTLEELVPWMAGGARPERRHLSLVTDEFVAQYGDGEAEADIDDAEDEGGDAMALRGDIEALLHALSAQDSSTGSKLDEDGDEVAADEVGSLDDGRPEDDRQGQAQGQGHGQAQERVSMPWCQAALASLVAVAAMVVLFWHAPAGSPTSPPAAFGATTPAFSIARTVSDHDMTLIVSHGEHDTKTNITRLHTYVCNASDQDQPTTLSVGDAPAGAPPEPMVVPARSVRHEVVEVSDEDSRILLKVNTMQQERAGLTLEIR